VCGTKKCPPERKFIPQTNPQSSPTCPFPSSRPFPQ
jgi:hypothetical protein